MDFFMDEPITLAYVQYTQTPFGIIPRRIIPVTHIHYPHDGQRRLPPPPPNAVVPPQPRGDDEEQRAVLYVQGDLPIDPYLPRAPVPVFDINHINDLNYLNNDNDNDNEDVDAAPEGEGEGNGEGENEEFNAGEEEGLADVGRIFQENQGPLGRWLGDIAGGVDAAHLAQNDESDHEDDQVDRRQDPAAADPDAEARRNAEARVAGAVFAPLPFDEWDDYYNNDYYYDDDDDDDVVHYMEWEAEPRPQHLVEAHERLVEANRAEEQRRRAEVLLQMQRAEQDPGREEFRLRWQDWQLDDEPAGEVGVERFRLEPPPPLQQIVVPPQHQGRMVGEEVGGGGGYWRWYWGQLVELNRARLPRLP